MEQFFEEQKSNYQAWAFTIKKLGPIEICDEEDYAEYERFLRTYGFLECCHYEKDSKGKIHIHGIIVLRKGFLRKKLTVHGFHIKLVELYNRVGWEQYITKCPYLFDKEFEPPGSPIV